MDALFIVLIGVALVAAPFGWLLHSLLTDEDFN